MSEHARKTAIQTPDAEHSGDDSKSWASADDDFLDEATEATHLWMAIDTWPIERIEKLLGLEVHQWNNQQAKAALSLLLSEIRLAEAKEPAAGENFAVAALRELLIIAMSLGRDIDYKSEQLRLAEEELSYLRKAQKRKRPFHRPPRPGENPLYDILRIGKKKPKPRGPTPLVSESDLRLQFGQHRNNGLRPGEAFARIARDALKADPDARKRRGYGPSVIKREADNLKKRYSKLVAIDAKK